MKKFIVICLLAVLCYEAGARKKPADNMNTVGISYLDQNFKTYDALQKEIHAYAEPGYLEYKSSKALADHLEANGFKIEWGVAEIPTAFVATYGEGSPVVGFLGEFDALPGMSQDTSAFRHPAVPGGAGHACGHNLLGSGPAAGAVAVSKWLAEGHKGTVKFFGCPAEEGGGGKNFMVRDGVFDGCDVMFDWHPGTNNNVNMNTCASVVRINFNFKGKSAHAGSMPWNGRSALDGVEALNHMMNMMREHLIPEARVHYMISNGGQAPNAVPETAQVIYYLRNKGPEATLDLLERAINAAEGAAMGTDTEMTYQIINGSHGRLPNKVLSEIVLKNMKLVGPMKLDEREKEYLREVRRNSGMEDVNDLSNFDRIPAELPEGGYMGSSSDVGTVSQIVPLASFVVSTVVSGCGLHTWQQTAIGGTTVGTKALLNVAKIFYLSALDVFENPSAVTAAWDEYYSVQGRDYKFKSLVGDCKPALDYCKGL